MKKFSLTAFVSVLMILFCITAQAKDNSISGIYTVAGSFGHSGFVPHSVAVRGGELIVSDKDSHKLSVVDITTGNVTATYGNYGENPGQLKFPRSVAVYENEIIVCDSFNKRIVFVGGNNKQTGVMNLLKEPMEITVAKDMLYVLLSDGITIEGYDLKEKSKRHSFSLKYPAHCIGATENTLIVIGDGKAYTINTEDMAYKEEQALAGARCISSDGQNICVLYEDRVSVFDGELKEQSGFKVSGGTDVCMTEDAIYVSDSAKGLIYGYRNGSIFNTYGKERRTTEIKRISAAGKTVAVCSENVVDVYKNGSYILSVDNEGAVDAVCETGRLYVLGKNSVTAYEFLGDNEGKWSATKTGHIDANASYSFSSVALSDSYMYITEENTGKILRLSTDMQVFTTVINKLNTPKAVAIGKDMIYVAEKERLCAFDLKGQLLYETKGSFDAVGYDGAVYAITKGDKEITCFDEALAEKEPITHEGYFLSLSDIAVKRYGVYACDDLRKEIMLITTEDLDISADNVSVNGTAFTGTAIQGQTITVEVSGAGMLNFLPDIGDVRYKPVYCGIDGKSEFKEQKGRFTADISLQNVGNYTLKAVYQKQIYHADGWKDALSADSTVVKEIAITVGSDEEYIRFRAGETANSLKILGEELLSIWKQLNIQ